VKGVAKTARQLGEQHVAQVVPECAVDLLEPVEIDEEDGDRATAGARFPDRQLHALVKAPAVREPREVVVKSLVTVCLQRRADSLSARRRSVTSRQMPWTPIGRPLLCITRVVTSAVTFRPSAMNSCSQVVTSTSHEGGRRQAARAASLPSWTT
jgi:hypothetical protein